MDAGPHLGDTRPAHPTIPLKAIRRVVYGVAALLAFSAASASSWFFCSWLRVPSYRTPMGVFFIGTSLPDTVPVPPGDMAERARDSGPLRPNRPSLYGQLVRIEQVGAPWAHLLPPQTREVVMVPWDNNSACSPTPWGESARWLPPGTRGVYRAELRKPGSWAANRPTLDAMGPDLHPYVAKEEAEYARAASRSDTRTRPPDQRRHSLQVLSEPDFLGFVEALPLRDSLEAHPDSAVAALERWEASHASVRDAWPAADIVRLTRWHADEARMRLLPSPFAGTFRVSVTFGTGRTTVLYLRTGPRPVSSIRGSARFDVARDLPISGYYLVGKLATSLRGLESKDASGGNYVGASLAPYLVSRDSSLWRGELDALVAVAELDPRPFVRSHAQFLFRPSERLRDTTQFYTPGTWVLDHRGRLVYHYELLAGPTLLYSVTAERLSRETVGN